jgi:hypothetical protein
MVRMIIALLITAALSVSCGQSKMARPLTAGMPNTITLANGQVVYDLNGDWGGIYDMGRFGTYEEIVRITQKGDQFVGIKLIGGLGVIKNEKTIKGTLEQNRFKKVYINSASGGSGWLPSWGKISEDGNKIIIKGMFDIHEAEISLQRK